ncbi:hypothetical protein MAR_014130 [Mya arenaria]|uniref:Uncharacterized protein n=1 Tax=Mya arenaria TaxID=6604 RepID=A0ABY7G5U5_MYAAR|nr:hypothetical protein MAR_014130 [Mya arenaria]
MSMEDKRSIEMNRMRITNENGHLKLGFSYEYCFGLTLCKARVKYKLWFQWFWYLPHHLNSNKNKPGKARDTLAVALYVSYGGLMGSRSKIFCIQVYLFGATSSHSCVRYVLKRTVTVNTHMTFCFDICSKSVSHEYQVV